MSTSALYAWQAAAIDAEDGDVKDPEATQRFMEFLEFLETIKEAESKFKKDHIDIIPRHSDIRGWEAKWWFCEKRNEVRGARTMRDRCR